jgi:uncharacterized repeat protein (TIGR02543 family)
MKPLKLFALVFVTLITVCSVSAQSIKEIASLPEPTIDHSASLLIDGKVLIVAPTGRSDVFNPSTDTWSRAGSMMQGSYGHSAAQLTDGRVILVGGYLLSSVVNSQGVRAVTATVSRAEIYDPATQTWSATGSMSQPRVLHTLTLLANGAALVVGGATNATAVANSATALIERYVIATGTWSSVGSLPAARQQHTTTLLPNGSLLVLGGRDGSDVATNTCWLIDPSSYVVTNCVPMPVVRGGHAATLLSNGKVYVSGGTSSNAAFSSIYDPVADSWSSTNQAEPVGINARYQIERNANSVLSVAGGDYPAYSIGGTLPQISVEVKRYFPGTNQSAVVGGIGLAAPTLTQLNDGRILVVGGYDGVEAYCSVGCFHRPRATSKAYVIDRATVSFSLDIFGGGVPAFPEAGQRYILPLRVTTSTTLPERSGIQILAGTDSCVVGQDDAGCHITITTTGSKTYSVSYAGDSEYKPAQASFSMPVDTKLFIEGVDDFGNGKTVSFNTGGVVGPGACGVNFGPIPSQCQLTPVVGTSVQLNASGSTGSAGWSFVGWQGACAGTTQPCTVVSPMSGSLVVRAVFAPNASLPLKLDVDANGGVDAATDGQLIWRFLSRVHDGALTQSALGANPQRASPGAIEERLSRMSPLLDVDLNGRADAATDGVMILRFLLGFRSNALTQNVMGQGARRTDATEIATHLQSLMP